MIDRQYIGHTMPTFEVLVEKGRLRFFAKATGQTDPVYTDEAAARAAGHPSLPAPPTFAACLYLDVPDPFAWYRELGIDLARVLGIAMPKVAILSAVETVNPNIASTLDAAALCGLILCGAAWSLCWADSYAEWGGMPLVHPGLWTALAIGVVQCLSMIPGVSRSGATIMGARAMGVERKTAAEFSFFVAVPTMMGATTLALYKEGAALAAQDVTNIAIGFVVSFVVAIVVIKAFLAIVTRYGFGPFAWYRIVAGIGALVWLGQIG